MKKYFLLGLLFLCLLRVNAQPMGSVERIEFTAKTLVNSGGENPTRHVSIYLPPKYDEQTSQRYPVIYYLHGFLNNDIIQPVMKSILDKGIASGKIKPFILVIPDHKTIFDGSQKLLEHFLKKKLDSLLSNDA